MGDRVQIAAGVSLEPVTSSIYPVQVLVGFSLSAGGTTFREDSQDSTEQTSDAFIEDRTTFIEDRTQNKRELTT